MIWLVEKGDVLGWNMSDAYIINGPKFLPPSLRGKANKYKILQGEEPNKPPR